MSKNAKFWYAQVAKNMGHRNDLVFNGRQITRKIMNERRKHHRKTIYWKYLDAAIDFPQNKEEAFFSDCYDKKLAFGFKFHLLALAKSWRGQ